MTVQGGFSLKIEISESDTFDLTKLCFSFSMACVNKKVISF